MGVGELFLSHSSSDEPVPGRLAETLRAHGIPVWMSAKDIRGAQQWHDEIGNALRRCDWFAVLLSGQSVQSMWVKRELMFALSQHRFQNRIVPILLEPCDYAGRLSWTLDALEMVDFTGPPHDGCRALLRVWGSGLDVARCAFPAQVAPPP